MNVVHPGDEMQMDAMQSLRTIASSLNLKLFNPPHQDRVNGQFTRIVDQLQLIGPAERAQNVIRLKQLTFAWLTRSTVTTFSTRSGTIRRFSTRELTLSSLIYRRLALMSFNEFISPTYEEL